MAGEGVQLEVAAHAGEVDKPAVDAPDAVKGVVLERRVERHHSLSELCPG